MKKSIVEIEYYDSLMELDKVVKKLKEISEEKKSFYIKIEKKYNEENYMIELDMSGVGIKNYEISVKVDDNEWQNIDNEEEEVKDIIKLLSKKDEHSEVKSKCEIECSGEAEKIAIFFNLLARWGNCGHSYDYVIDDDNNFGYDGDGSDRIHSVN